MNAGQIHTNDTLATSRKPAAKTASKIIAPTQKMAVPLALFPQEDGTLLLCGNDIEINILRSPYINVDAHCK